MVAKCILVPSYSISNYSCLSHSHLMFIVQCLKFFNTATVLADVSINDSKKEMKLCQLAQIEDQIFTNEIPSSRRINNRGESLDNS